TSSARTSPAVKPGLMLGGPACVIRGRDTRTHLLEPPQTVVDRRLRQLHAVSKLAEVQLWVSGAPSGHLAQRRRQRLESPGGFQLLDRRHLTESGADRLADVRRLGVEAAVHLAAD